jgi:hypothetical protein
MLSRIHHLGHVSFGESIVVNPVKVEVIVKWPAPKNVLEVHSFMGIVGYYQKFIEGSLELANPTNMGDHFNKLRC